jgi:hypothetical protein
MKKLIFLLAILIVAISTTKAQEMDSRLLVKYKKSEVKKMMKENPSEYQFLVTALDRGMFICEIPAEKGKDVVFDGTLSIDPAQNHTFLSLGKDIIDRYQYFKIEGTNKMVVIQPRVFLDPNVLKK